MIQLLKSRRALLVTAVALVAAFISAKSLAQGSPLVTIPWGILALLTAYIAKSKKEALVLGGYLGFVASYSYLWFDDTSSYTLGKIIFLAMLIILPSLLGFLCGMFAAWIGWLMRARFRSDRHQQ